jgi:transposase
MISKDKAEKESGIRAKVVRVSGINLFGTFLSASEKHVEEIPDYFNGRLMGGFAEGLNNRIRVFHFFLISFRLMKSNFLPSNLF